MPPIQKQDPIREQVVRARRAQILEASAQVFAEKGYHRATIKQIAERAGIADGTIYNYFENKAGLLIGLLQILDEVGPDERQLSGLSQADFQKTFRKLVHQRLSLYLPRIDMLKAVLPEVLANPDLSELYLQRSVTPTLAALEKHLEARAGDEHIREVDYALTARAITAMLLGLLILHILGDSRLQTEAEDLPEVLASLLYDGLKPQT